MSASRFQTALVFRHSFAFGILIVIWVFVGYCSAITNKNGTAKPTGPVAADCSLEKRSCRNCTAYLNCVWCFSNSFCVDKSSQKKIKCEEDDWYRGDCDKPEKETVLLYVLLACALVLLVIVILLVLYIFFCKGSRKVDYQPVDTKDKKIRRNRTPLMSKKFKPVGSRTDELKKKYGLQ